MKKLNGGHRLVTAFVDVGRHSKPQPSLMPDIDSTLRQIAQWKGIIATDLTQSFYQIPLSRVYAVLWSCDSFQRRPCLR